MSKSSEVKGGFSGLVPTGQWALCPFSLWSLAPGSSWITCCSWSCWAAARSSSHPPPPLSYSLWAAPMQTCRHADSDSPVLGSQASRTFPAHFVNLIPDIKFLITGTQFSLLGDLKLQTLLFARPFLLSGKPLPNSRISLCLLQAFYLFPTRQAQKRFICGLCRQSTSRIGLCTLPPHQYIVQSTPEVVLRSWQNQRCFSNKNLYNSKEGLEFRSVSGFIPNPQSSECQIQM